MSTLNYEAMCKLMINHDEILAAPLRILGVSRRISGVRYASPRYNRLCGKACHIRSVLWVWSTRWLEYMCKEYSIYCSYTLITSTYVCMKHLRIRYIPYRPFNSSIISCLDSSANLVPRESLGRILSIHICVTMQLHWSVTWGYHLPGIIMHRHWVVMPHPESSRPLCGSQIDDLWAVRANIPYTDLSRGNAHVSQWRILSNNLLWINIDQDKWRSLAFAWQIVIVMADIPHVDKMGPWNRKLGFSFSFPIIEIDMSP